MLFCYPKQIMKALFAYFALLLPFYTVAQAVPPTDSLNRQTSKFYVGVGFDLGSYPLYYRTVTIPGPVYSEYFRPLALNVGYQLNDQISFQVGAAYGSNQEEDAFPDYVAPDTYIDRRFTSKTKVLAVPLTTRVILVDKHKRFPVYATFNIMPAWGETRFTSTENQNNIPVTKTFQDSGINLFLTAGVGFNYKIWRRYSGYAEILLIESEPSSGNTRYYRHRGENADYFQFIWGMGFGFKYAL
jgi:hypothetical protein